MKTITFLLGLIFLSMSVSAQHHTTQDSMKEVSIEEVVVSSQVGINKRLEKEQRASKQANIDQILDRIAGVQMVRRGNYAWEPTIRSLNAAQINLTIDGMAIFGACTDRMDPISSYIEPSNLQQINVNIGPYFNSYAGGMAGGMNFKLSNPELSKTPKLNGLLGTGFESNSQAIQTLGSLQYSSEKVAVLMNGIFRKAQNYKAGNLATIAHSQFQKWNASVAVNYKLNSKNQILAQYLADYGQDIGYPALTMDVSYANANIASLTHVYQPSTGGLKEIKTKVYFNHIDHAMDDSKRPAETVAMHMDMPGLSWTSGFYSESGYEIGKHFLQARLNGYVNRLTANMTMYPKEGSPMFMYTLPDAQRSLFSFDFSDKFYLSEQWNLDFMGTYSFAHSDIYSQKGKEQLTSLTDKALGRSNHLANMNLTTHFHPSGNFHLMAKLGFANRSASLQEYYGFYLFNRLDNYDYLGNVDLKTEKSIQTSFGFSYQSDVFSVEANGYNYFFRDYIAGRINSDYQVMTIGATGVKQNQNLDNANLIGAELALRLNILKDFEWLSTAAYTEGKDLEGNYLPLISPFTNNNTFLYKWKGYNAQIEVAYFAKQDKVSPEVYGDSNTGSATLFNVGIRKGFKLKQHRITTNLRLENIFDRYYFRHQDLMKIARPGRNLIAQINLSF